MAKPPKPADAPPPAQPAPPALPSSGGAWIRLADGTLIRDPAEHPGAETPPETPPETVFEPPLKDA